MSSTGGLSGLIVEIPDAEPVVARHRAELDANARLGVPAHVTVLFPFVPPERIDASVLGELGELFASSPAFRAVFSGTDWFDEDVLWLAAEDPEPFLALTRRVHDAFPAYPPYEGQYADLAPHLTVAHGCPVAKMREAEREVVPLLPVATQVDAVSLLTQQRAGGHWSRIARFPLAGPRRQEPGPG